MSAPASKSQRIDLWRHEVAVASSASTDNSMPPSPRAQKRTSFLSRLLKSKSNESSNREEEFESTAMYRVTATGDAAKARAPKGKGNGKDRNRDTGDCGGEGESMAIADVSASSSGPEGGLVAKQERLERAARLLGKDGGREGKG